MKAAIQLSPPALREWKRAQVDIWADVSLCLKIGFYKKKKGFSTLFPEQASDTGLAPWVCYLRGPTGPHAWANVLSPSCFISSTFLARGFVFAFLISSPQIM